MIVKNIGGDMEVSQAFEQIRQLEAADFGRIKNLKDKMEIVSFSDFKTEQENDLEKAYQEVLTAADVDKDLQKYAENI